MSRRALSEIMERVRRRGGPWSAVQDIGAPPEVVGDAWRASDDPFAMMVLLAALHPGRHVDLCEALVTGMSFLPAMRREAEAQARRKPGMLVDGPSPFNFVYLAQRMRNALADVPPAEASAIASAAAIAIRAVVADPFTLPSAPGSRLVR